MGLSCLERIIRISDTTSMMWSEVKMSLSREEMADLHPTAGLSESGPPRFDVGNLGWTEVFQWIKEDPEDRAPLYRYESRFLAAVAGLPFDDSYMVLSRTSGPPNFHDHQTDWRDMAASLDQMAVYTRSSFEKNRPIAGSRGSFLIQEDETSAGSFNLYQVEAIDRSDHVRALYDWETGRWKSLIWDPSYRRPVEEKGPRLTLTFPPVSDSSSYVSRIHYRSDTSADSAPIEEALSQFFEIFDVDESLKQKIMIEAL